MRILWLALFCTGLAGAAEWQTSKFPDWSQETVQRLLTDSPWARPKRVSLAWRKREEREITYKDIPGADHGPQHPIGSPVGGIGPRKSSLPDRADILIRWASALPVRHATALYKQREDKLDAGKLNALIGAPESDYVLEIFGVPAELAHMGAGMVEIVAKDSSYLRLGSGRTLRPKRVEVVVGGLTMSVRVHFPRTEPIRVTDKDIEAYVDLQVFSIKEKFKLSSMMYLDYLEI